jgi:multiple sugar transport system ATP-binding protein
VLVGGRFVQVGTPEEIYDRPATIEVAKLFGDPTINLLEAEVQAAGGATVASVGRRRFSLAAGYEDMAGRRVTLGIRPENIDFTDPGHLDALPVRVAALLPLNDRLVRLVVGEDGHEFNVSKSSGTRALGEGETAAIRAEPSTIILFDSVSGERIAPKIESRERVAAT